jgi:hypothetical protein
LSITLTFLAKSNLTNPIDYIKQRLLTERNQDKVEKLYRSKKDIKKSALPKVKKLFVVHFAYK